MPLYQPTNQKARIISILAIGTILLLSMMLRSTALTATDSPQFVGEVKDRGDLTQQRQDDASQLPPPLVNAVRKDLSGRTGIAPSKLNITQYSRETWRNGCLGLPKPGEFCTQALVSGWRVALCDGRQTWFYRTDSSGQKLRLENADTPVNNLPEKLLKSLGLPPSDSR